MQERRTGEHRRSRVVVAGSINADIVVRTPRLPRPGETIAGSSVAWFPGGKGANQAAAAAAAGAATTFLGCVGTDDHGPRLVAALESFGVDTRVRIVDGPSGQAFIAVDDEGENSIVVIGGANDDLMTSDVVGLDLGATDVVVAPLESPATTIAAFLRDAAPARRILNPSPAERCTADVLAEADIVIANETEAEGIGDIDAELIVTLGAAGVLVGGKVIEPPPVQPVDTTGAGDCFTGTFAAMLVAGIDLDGAAEAAVHAASRSTTRPGAMASYRG